MKITQAIELVSYSDEPELSIEEQFDNVVATTKGFEFISSNLSQILLSDKRIRSTALIIFKSNEVI